MEEFNQEREGPHGTRAEGIQLDRSQKGKRKALQSARADSGKAAEAQQHAKPVVSEHGAGWQAPIEDLQAVNLLPADPEERRRLDEQVTFRIFLAASHILNDADQEPLKRLYQKIRSLDRQIGAVLQVTEPPETSRRLFNALDDAICEHARIIGMRIWLSRFVYPRICQWEDEPNGAELHEKLGKALALNVRISRGQATAPIDALLKRVRQELISEVKRLRDLLKGRLPERSLPNEEKILSVALELIGTPDHHLIHLKTDSTALRGFNVKDVEAGKKTNSWLFELFMGTASPAVFVDALLGYGTGRSGEALRQALTKL